MWYSARPCLKNAFRQMFGTVCGRLNHLTDDVPNEGGVGGQRHKGLAGMIFQTRSRDTNWYMRRRVL